MLSFGTDFILFGIAAYLIAWFGLAPKASGHLPLTHASAVRLAAALWITVALASVGVALMGVGLVVGNTLEPVRSRIGLWILIVGAVTMVTALAAVFVRPLLGPGARVYKPKPGESDRVIELKRLHPAFVKALTDMNELRGWHVSDVPGARP